MMKINTCIVQTKCNIAKSSPIYRIMNELTFSSILLSSQPTYTYKKATHKHKYCT